jgi:hypothetical protein
MIPSGLPGLPYDLYDLPMILNRKARGSQEEPGAASRGQEKPETEARRKARKGHRGHEESLRL